MLIPLKFRQPQFFTDLVVANAQLLNLLVRHVYLLTRLEVHTVDDAVRVDMLAVDMRTDQNFTAVEVSSKSVRCFVRCARVDGNAFRETLHHVVEHHAAVLVVQMLRTQELIERRFRLTSDAADERLTVTDRFSELRDVAHHAFHAAACLCAFLVVHEMNNCDFRLTPSCISRRVTLIFANACGAVSRLANCTLPMFASTVS